jgi:hypothetical protein
MPTQTSSDHTIRLAPLDTGTDLFPLIPRQHPRTRPIQNNMTHPAMLADQIINRATRQIRQLGSLGNR